MHALRFEFLGVSKSHHLYQLITKENIRVPARGITPDCLVPTEGRKEIIGLPRLEVQMVMSLHVGAGN